MTERKIYNPNETHADHRRHEWVELDGGWVCVRESTAAAMNQAIDRSVRPRIGPDASPLDRGEFMLWKILHSCYDGEGPEAKQVFGPEHAVQISEWRMEVYGRVVQAIERVNGATPEEAEAVEAFTDLRRGAGASGKRSSASNNSTASLKK